MSAPAQPQPRRPARKPLPSAWNVIVATLGLFLVILTLLALQVRSGKDPSLSQSGTSGGTGSSSATSSSAAARQVVTKTS